MPDDALVRVAQYDTRGNAHLARTRLEEAGIPCLLANEAQAGLSMMFDSSGSGVQVKVPADRAEEAKALLDEK